jgi:DedD protein
MADPVADNADFAVDELRRKARRRLVGAIVIALAAATILPLVLEQEQKPLGDDVSVQIPAIDNGRFVSRLKDDKSKDAPAGAKADGGAVKATEAGAAVPAPASTANSGIAAPAAVSAPTPDGGSRPAPDARDAASDANGKVPQAKAETKAATKAAPKAEAKATPAADVASRAHDVKPEPKSASTTPAAATPSAPPSGPPPTDVAVAAPAPAAAPESPVVPAMPASSPVSDAPKPEGYVVQLGAFTDNYGANALANKLKKAGYPAFTEPVETSRGTLYRVRVGAYSTRRAAVDARNRLKADGHNGDVTAAK